jgi:hypothetical protein
MPVGSDCPPRPGHRPPDERAIAFWRRGLCHKWRLAGPQTQGRKLGMSSSPVPPTFAPPRALPRVPVLHRGSVATLVAGGGGLPIRARTELHLARPAPRHSHSRRDVVPGAVGRELQLHRPRSRRRGRDEPGINMTDEAGDTAAGPHLGDRDRSGRRPPATSVPTREPPDTARSARWRGVVNADTRVFSSCSAPAGDGR